MQDLLISNTRFGDALADMFSTPANDVSKTDAVPDFTFMLQRGHGFATVGMSIEESVYRAVYTTYEY